MSGVSAETMMHGLVFDYLGFVIAVLTIIQLVVNLFAHK